MKKALQIKRLWWVGLVLLTILGFATGLATATYWMAPPAVPHTPVEPGQAYKAVVVAASNPGAVITGLAVSSLAAAVSMQRWCADRLDRAVHDKLLCLIFLDMLLIPIGIAIAIGCCIVEYVPG
jgi:hypothetical protein